MVATALSVVLWHSPQLVAAALAIFLAPGGAVLIASGIALRTLEWPAYAFATSLVLLTGTFALCLAAESPIAATPVTLAVLTAIAATAFHRFRRADAAPLPRAGRTPVPATALLAIFTLASIVAAIAFAPVGSVDRWWYLAYVRGYIDAPVLDLAEPFLGTGESFARFGLHPWLLGLAMWSWVSGVDPIAVFETAAPALVVVVAVSASFALARELFGRGSRVWLSVLATILLWSGGLLPVLARAAEDKILAAAVLMPLCLASFLRSFREGRESSRSRMPALALLAIASAATAAVHALVYAFVLVALLPVAAWFGATAPKRRRQLALACAVLVVVAVAPALSGVVVRERLHDIGAEAARTDHPVVRVHGARERLIEFESGWYVANPRLLLHPLALLAGIGVVVLSRRRPVVADSALAERMLEPGAAQARPSIAAFLLLTTLVPLSIAFLPPLPSLAGSFIPPWMVYRVLWVLPLAPLAAFAADAIAARYGDKEAIAALIVLALGMPSMIENAQRRLAEPRERLGQPSSEEFRGLIDAIAALPADAMLVAAPELAERLPALTARHVVAGLDRSTIVFSGSRERGEARLRARASLLAGEPDAGTLAREAAVAATHAVYDPRAVVRPGCGQDVYRSEAFALCTIGSEGGAAPAALEGLPASGGAEVAQARCEPSMPRGRRDPWAAAPPHARCTVDVAGGSEVALRLESSSGRAADELRVLVRDARGNTLRAVERTTGKETVELALPPSWSGPLVVDAHSSFLPFVRIERMAVVRRNAGS